MSEDDKFISYGKRFEQYGFVLTSAGVKPTSRFVECLQADNRFMLNDSTIGSFEFSILVEPNVVIATIERNQDVRPSNTILAYGFLLKVEDSEKLPASVLRKAFENAEKAIDTLFSKCTAGGRRKTNRRKRTTRKAK